MVKLTNTDPDLEEGSKSPAPPPPDWRAGGAEDLPGLHGEHALPPGPAQARGRR